MTKYYPYPFQVGDIVVPKDGSDYQSEIIDIEFKRDTVKHRIIPNGPICEKSIFGMTVRYQLHPQNDRLKKLKAFK